MSETPLASRSPSEDFDDDEKYINRSFDHVARVRAAKEAAQREMESFGDASEYEITILKGQLKEKPAADSQSSLHFQGDDSIGTQEKA